MPRRCTVCTHTSREEIEAELIEGKEFREMAARFSLSSAALFRHRRGHLPERLVKAREAAEISRAEGLVGQLEALQAKAKQILEKAESDGDLRTALAGVKELSRLIELVAKMTREQLTSDPAGRTSADAIDVDDVTAEKMAQAFLERRRKERP
jgi:hypothetical protein